MYETRASHSVRTDPNRACSLRLPLPAPPPLHRTWNSETYFEDKFIAFCSYLQKTGQEAVDERAQPACNVLQICLAPVKSRATFFGWYTNVLVPEKKHSALPPSPPRPPGSVRRSLAKLTGSDRAQGRRKNVTRVQLHEPHFGSRRARSRDYLFGRSRQQRRHLARFRLGADRIFV